MRGGLSQMYILRTPPGFWANDVALTVIAITAAAPRKFGVIFFLPLAHLFVEPDVFEARAVVDAVDHLGHAFHPWLVADGTTRVIEDRPGIVFGQLAFDLPYQLP